MANKTFNEKTKESFLLDPKHTYIAGFDIPEQECLELGISEFIDRQSNARTLEEAQPEGFVASFAAVSTREGNVQSVGVRKVKCDKDDKWAYVKTDVKTGEQTRESYMVVVSSHGRHRVRGCRRANAEVLGAETPKNLEYKMLKAESDSRYTTPEQTAMRRVIENVMRRQESPMETARYLREKVEGGLDVSHIAKMLGKSAAYIYQNLSLTDLSPALQDKVDSGELPKTAAVELAQNVQDHKKQEEVVAQSTQSNGKIKGKDLSQNVKAVKTGRKPRQAQKTPKKAEILEMIERLRTISPEAADALYWVCTGEREGLDAMLLEDRPEPQEMPPAIMAL